MIFSYNIYEPKNKPLKRYKYNTMNPTMNTTNIYERGNDYDQSEIWSKAPCGAYVTLEMFNQTINKLIIMIEKKQDKLNIGYIEYTAPEEEG